jgi:hypothetical protein
VPPRRQAPGKRKAVWQPEGRGPQRRGAGGGRGRALDPRQLGPRRRRGRAGPPREGSTGEGGTRTAAACNSEAQGLPGFGDMGRRTLIRSLGEASSFTVQMRSFQGHVCTGPAGVRVRECVRVRVSVCGGVGGGAASWGDPGVPTPAGPSLAAPTPAFSGPPRSGPGILARPRPAPTLRRHHHRRPAPTARSGGREEPAATPPVCVPLGPCGKVCPPSGHSPYPSQIRWLPAPPATGGRRRIAAQRSPDRPPNHPSARPRGPPGSPAPPGRGGPGAGGRGGGPGRARLPFSAAAAEPARGPAPAPSPAPRGPRREPIIPGRGPRPQAPRPQAPGRAPERGQSPEGGGGRAGAPAAARSRAPRLRPAVEGAPRGIV